MTPLQYRDKQKKEKRTSTVLVLDAKQKTKVKGKTQKQFGSRLFNRQICNQCVAQMMEANR